MKHFIEDIFKQHDRIKRSKSVEFDLYPLSEQLFDEFYRVGIIDRLKAIPQLGSIPVSHILQKSRYDYAVLQIWLHKKAHDLINESLEYSYASTMHKEDFTPNFELLVPYNKPTVEEFIQTLTLAYNAGHSYNTFMSSRAMIFALKESNDAYSTFEAQFADKRGCKLLRKVVDNDDYHHFHLVNSILVLEKCNGELFSVKIAKELLFAYLGINTCSKKLKYVFNVFRKIRNLSITIFDLQLAHTPFRIRVSDDNSLRLFLKEYLAQYNDNGKAIQIVNSLTKLLSAFIYDDEKRTIITYYISKGIGRKVLNQGVNDYYNSLFLNKASPINKKSSSSLPIDSVCMKLTFDEAEKEYATGLFQKLDHMNHVRAALYNRHDRRCTLVVSVSKNQVTNVSLQLRILKTVISSLRKIPGIKPDDIKYLISTKYFLSHFFNNRLIRINPTGNNIDSCVYCIKGFANKRKALDLHISNYVDPGAKHEVENMRTYLQTDTTKDISILVPASIVVFDSNGGKKDIEFDGIIIHPYRKSNQIVFLEAKISRAAGKAEKELKQKLTKLGFVVSAANIIRTGNDAYHVHNV